MTAPSRTTGASFATSVPSEKSRVCCSPPRDLTTSRPGRTTPTARSSPCREAQQSKPRRLPVTTTVEGGSSDQLLPGSYERRPGVPPLASIRHGQSKGKRVVKYENSQSTRKNSPGRHTKELVCVQNHLRCCLRTNKLLDQAVRVVLRPATTLPLRFARCRAAATTLVQRSLCKSESSVPSTRGHELIARDITAAVDAGAPEVNPSLEAVSVRLHAEKSQKMAASGSDASEIATCSAR